MLSAKIREKSIRSMRLLAVLLVPVTALIIGGAVSKGWAQPVCWWNIELNASDLDVGVRGFYDDDPWKELEIENPSGRTFVEIEAESRKMKRQGLAEWFFESGEPTLFEVSFHTFFRRFKPGFWEFEAEPVGGGEVECEELFTHVIPCAPEIDAEQENGDIFITWLGVTSVVDTVTTDANVADADPEEFDAEELLACDESLAPDIIGYEVIVEEAESEKIYKIDIPASAGSMDDPPEFSVTVPPEFLALGVEFQYEVLAIEESGNQTITEEEFCLDAPGGDLVACPE